MSNYEKDIKELIERMNAQQMYKPQQPQGNSFTPNMGSTDQSPHLYNINNITTNQGVDQTPPDAVNSVRPMGKPIQKMSRTELAKSQTRVEGACPECGMLHPPLMPGQKCPMAPVKKQETGEVVDVNKFLVDLKNIIISQADSKKVKDYEKMFKNIIINVTKFLEGYKE